MKQGTINTDSIKGGSSGPSNKKSVIQRINGINEVEMPKLLRNMRIVNVILSIFQAIAGFMGIFSFITLNITGTLVSLYVIMFALVFLLFECRLTSMEGKIRKNFGFLYSYKGRASFIFFIGFLDFGMSTAMGYVAGIFMCLNALFNLLVMCRHPDFRSGQLDVNADPTANYTTGNQEATSYLNSHPELAMKAGTFAFNAASSSSASSKV